MGNILAYVVNGDELVDSFLPGLIKHNLILLGNTNYHGLFQSYGQQFHINNIDQSSLFSLVNNDIFSDDYCITGIEIKSKNNGHGINNWNLAINSQMQFMHIFNQDYNKQNNIDLFSNTLVFNTIYTQNRHLSFNGKGYQRFTSDDLVNLEILGGNNNGLFNDTITVNINYISLSNPLLEREVSKWQDYLSI